MVEQYKSKQTNYSDNGFFQVFCLQHALTHCAHYQEVKNSLNLFTAGQWNMTDEIYDILCRLKTNFCSAEYVYAYSALQKYAAYAATPPN
jgi:hypothetical protein